MLIVVLMISIKCAFSYIGCQIIDDENLDWASPKFDLIDRFPERSLYPDAPLNRNKRVIADLDGLAGADIRVPDIRYVDPILMELESAPRSQCVHSKGVYRQIKCINDDDRSAKVSMMAGIHDDDDDDSSSCSSQLKVLEAENKIGNHGD